MTIDELQQKFNEMHQKKWRTKGSHTAATIAGFWMNADGVGYIPVIYANQQILLNADTLLPCGITDDLPFIEEVGPYANWQIDAKIWVSDEDRDWRLKGHFAGIDDEGNPTIWQDGQTSWTSSGVRDSWDHAELAEDGE